MQGLAAGASEDGVVELWASTIGVRPVVQQPFPEPSYLTVAADGLGLPPEHADQATLAIHWELRQRAKAEDDTAAPTGACIARARHPTGDRPPGRCVEPQRSLRPELAAAVAILPAGPAEGGRHRW